jgi:hypothetical protein
MANFVKKDESLNPMGEGPFGSLTIVPRIKGLAALVKELGSVLDFSGKSGRSHACARPGKESPAGK